MLEKNKFSMRNITNERVTEYIEQKYSPLNQKMWRMRLDAENQYIPIVQRDVESLLISYLNILKPKNILEVGMAIGYSAITMSETLKDAKIVTLERSPEMYQTAMDNFEKFDKKDTIEVMYGDAMESLIALKEQVKKGKRDSFDFVFIDAGKSHYTDFWNEIMEMVHPGSVIFADNVLMRGMTVDNKYDVRDKHRTNIKNMREFIDTVTGDERYQTTLLPVGDGVTISYIR